MNVTKLLKTELLRHSSILGPSVKVWKHRNVSLIMPSAGRSVYI
jgi:hypothetical protein